MSASVVSAPLATSTSGPALAPESPEDSLYDVSNVVVRRDIRSISDEEFSEHWRFDRQIGSGCWGATYLAIPVRAVQIAGTPLTSKQLSADAMSRYDVATMPRYAALKIVVRKRTPTTAARIRALWSEYKVIRSLRKYEHPNLIAFSDFIVTPSFVMIAMDYHGKLLTIGVSEPRAAVYGAQLLDAIGFMHRKGFTHNDIKIANILLSYDDKPIIIDFGFAMSYKNMLASPAKRRTSVCLPNGVDVNILGKSTNERPTEPFMSSLSWGTPEYLAPERAKGLLHDERLADIWSLGITLYEMVVGRTPFEQDETEEFLTKEALQIYYDRTMSGQIYGEYTISDAFEQVVQSMVEADVLQRVSTCEEVAASPFFSPASALKTAALSPRKAACSSATPLTSTPQKAGKQFNVFIDPEGSSNVSSGPPTPPRATSPGKENLSPIRTSPLKQEAATKPLYNLDNAALRTPSPVKQGRNVTAPLALRSPTARPRRVSETTSIPQWKGRTVSNTTPAKPRTTLATSVNAVQPSYARSVSSMQPPPAFNGYARVVSPSKTQTPARVAVSSHGLGSSITAAVLKPSLNSIKRTPSPPRRLRRSSSFTLVESSTPSSENGRKPKGSLPESPLAANKALDSSFTERLERIQAYAAAITSTVETMRASHRQGKVKLPSPPALDRTTSADLDRVVDINQLEAYLRDLQAAASASQQGSPSPKRTVDLGRSLAAGIVQGDQNVSADNAIFEASRPLSPLDQETPPAPIILTDEDLSMGADLDASTVSITPSKDESFLAGEEEELDASHVAAGTYTEDTMMASTMGITQRLEAAGPSAFSTPTPTKELPKSRVSFDILNAWRRPSVDDGEQDMPFDGLPERVVSPTPSVRSTFARATSLFRPASRASEHRPQTPRPGGLSRIKSLLRSKKAPR